MPYGSPPPSFIRGPALPSARPPFSAELPRWAVFVVEVLIRLLVVRNPFSPRIPLDSGFCPVGDICQVGEGCGAMARFEIAMAGGARFNAVEEVPCVLVGQVAIDTLELFLLHP